MNNRRQTHNSFISPQAASEDFAAAIEAATGREQPIVWSDPMDEAAVVQALDTVLMSERPDRGLEVLVRAEVMDAIMPEVSALVGFGEGVRHKDVWEHTKKVVNQSPARQPVRWAALLHDIGKVATRKFEPNGQVTFIGHPEMGAHLFRRINRRLKLDDVLAAKVHFLIGAHLRASAYLDTWTDSAVRRFTKEIGEGLYDLLDLSRADITSKYAEKVRRGHEQIEALADRVAELKEIDAKPVPLPKGLGTVIIERFNVEPGRKLGNLISALKIEVEEGRLGVQQEFEHYLEFIEQNPSWIEAPPKPARSL